MPSHTRRTAARTVLLVGEGKTECAFLHHIKSLYIHRGCGVSAKIYNAHGKGPDHVVRCAIRQCQNAAFDRIVVLLDADLTMSVKIRRQALSRKVEMIESIPCIEGLLLKILAQHVPGTSVLCKSRVGKTLPARLTSKSDYQAKFTKSCLERQRLVIPELEKLLDCFSFNG